MLQLWKRWSIFITLSAPIIILTLVNPVFRQPGNIFNVWQQASIYGVLAVGQTIVIILGGFDLSVGAVAAVGGVIWYLVFGLEASYAGVFFGLVVAILCSGLIGVINGLLITKLDITPLIVTLGTLSLVRGFALVVSGGQALYAQGPGFEASNIIQGSVLGLPTAGVVFLAVAAVSIWLLRGTVYGQYVYAIGGNERAASLAGIPVARVKIITYAFCSLFAGLGGIILASRTASALPVAGVNYELQSITAAVIGGARLTGGKGSIPGTVLGVILLAVIGNALNLYDVPPFWQTGVTGAILIAAVGMGKFADGERSASRN